jgi:anti-anti-sigma factor
MKMVTAYDGGCAVVRLAGRLDGEAAEQLAEQLDRLLREGQRSVLLDMGEVTYLSSPGTQVLQRAYQEYSSLRGELKVGQPSAAALEALTLAELRGKLVVEADDVTTLERLRTSTMIRAIDLTRDSWRAPAATAVRGSYEVTSREAGATLSCRVIGHPEVALRTGVRPGDCRVVEFTERAFGVGIGGIGRAHADVAPRLGELVAAEGAVAYLPTEGAQVPDFDVGLGGKAPAALLASGIVCDGYFAQLARFSTQAEADAVPLSELAEVCLNAVGGDTMGLVMLGETAGLVGAWLRRSPGSATLSADADLQGMRDWLATTPQPIHEGTTSLVVGVASRRPDPLLAPQLRPLGGRAGLVGHFHAVVFTYRPVPQRTVALRVLVTKLFGQQRVRGVLHLLNDDRGAAGAGESQFRRGLCWAGPVTSVVATP